MGEERFVNEMPAPCETRMHQRKAKRKAAERRAMDCERLWQMSHRQGGLLQLRPEAEHSTPSVILPPQRWLGRSTACLKGQDKIPGEPDAWKGFASFLSLGNMPWQELSPTSLFQHVINAVKFLRDHLRTGLFLQLLPKLALQRVRFVTCRWDAASAGGNVQAHEEAAAALCGALCGRTEAAIYQQTRGDASCSRNLTFSFALGENVHASVASLRFQPFSCSYLFLQSRGLLLLQHLSVWNKIIF